MRSADADQNTLSDEDLCREAARDLKLSFVKVKGHSGNACNDLADRLARKALGL